MQIRNKIGEITVDDLSTISSLKRWMKSSLDIYNPDEIISDSHAEIILEYLEHKIREDKAVDRRFWLRTIKKLHERMKVEKKNEF
jgi:hypothetical protein